MKEVDWKSEVEEKCGEVIVAYKSLLETIEKMTDIKDSVDLYELESFILFKLTKLNQKLVEQLS